MEAYRDTVRAFLFDTYQKGFKGGTGKTFDWNLAVEAKAFGPPIFLSGGLDPSNIMAAISTVRPFAVDVNSGIEERPGKKNPELMKTLMQQVKTMNRNGSPGKSFDRITG
ncbi:MAG: phosphoribosylanthranilate isomerase [Deltaproteobacteria bacterium]|nr:phosphoribosylanthranilate isomerase [Deltaproteobacteria bacterium]